MSEESETSELRQAGDGGGDRASPLDARQARRRADPRALPFETTAELEPLDGMLGQGRAEEALRFGVGIQHRGFNIYVLGPTGTGKHRLVARELEGRAQAAPVPDDWVYVHRFEDPDRPHALRLSPGRGAVLVAHMERFVEDLGDGIRAAFEGDEIRGRQRLLEQKIEARHEEAFSALAERAEEKGLRLMRTPMGFAFAPVREGQVVDPAEFARLPPSEQEVLKARLGELEDALRDVMHEVPRWQREAREALRAMQREVAGTAVGQQLREVREAFGDAPQVSEWLDAVARDVVEHAPQLVASDPDEDDDEDDGALRRAVSRGVAGPLTRYCVNLLVDRRGLEGAPVVHEDHPTLERLVGRIDQRAELGALVSDFTLIKAGALHRANGGYLVLDARRLLASPSAYESLKRALRRGLLEIEPLGKALGLTTTTLEPEPVPLDLKVVLVGDRELYYLLSALDPEFDPLFKVPADLEDDVPWDDAHVTELSRLIAGVITAERLLPFHRSAVARLVEHAARLAEDQRKLSTHVTSLSDLMREADYVGRQRAAACVEEADVRAAVEARRRREERVRERVLERFHDGTMKVETAGEVVGQINGLSVLTVGRARFGQPSRITCRVRLGKGEVVDIEREVQLGGPIHSKGVLILAGYLSAHYGLERPLSLSASLVFEQSYGGVEGDSASLAELCALLSALADLPIRQRFALTGAVSQRGEVQAIGGVNEKIEGFFDVCRARGLAGQGVLIPQANVASLMLRDDVVEAVEAGLFSIHAVADVSEAIPLLTGLPAGERLPDGTYPEDTLHGRVERRLAHFAERAREHAASLVPRRPDGGDGAR